MSVLSRVTERILVNQHLQSALTDLPIPLVITNQFAYRPTSSTTAALVSIFAKVTELLKTNDFVHCITFDYSKAFDTLSHHAVSTKLSQLNIPSSIHNWIIDYLSDRTHLTQQGLDLSSSLSINASIVQGSVLGPNLFNINSTELAPLSPDNFYYKYADDAYLLVPSSNDHTILSEIQHHSQWALLCNLKLNPTKTAEIVFPAKKRLSPPPLVPGVQRVITLKILGVLVDSNLNFIDNSQNSILACNRSLFALRTMRMHGLSDNLLNQVFKATVLPKLLYAGPSWMGFINFSIIDRYEAFLRRAVRFGYYNTTDPTFRSLITKAENKLFDKVLQNESHVLFFLLPEKNLNPTN